jgi:hypothetical protein
MMETEAETYFTLFFSILIAFNSHVDILFRPYSAARLFFRYHTKQSQEKQKDLILFTQKQEETTKDKKHILTPTTELLAATSRILVRLPQSATKNSDLVLVGCLARSPKFSLTMETRLGLVKPHLEPT